MRLKCTFEVVDMGDEMIAVPIGVGANTIHGVLKLNKAGAEILNMLNKNVSEEGIIDNLTEKYENDRDTISSYVKNFINILRKKQLIIE